MISIVIPAYNRAAALQSCIESIMQQSYPGLEVIVIDDGSSDESVELMQRLKKQYEGITLIINPGNYGVNYSRNRGIERASGKFILFLDSDDRLAPGALNAIRDAAAAHPQTQHFLFLVSDRKEEFAQMKEVKPLQYGNWVQGTVGGDFIHVVAASVMKKFLFFEQFRMYEYLNWLRVFKTTAPQLMVPFIVGERERGRADSLTTAARLKNFSVIKGKFESQQLYYTLYHKDLQHFQSKALANKLLGAIVLGVACNRKKDCHRLVQYGNRLSVKLAGSLILLFPPALMRRLIIAWSSPKIVPMEKIVHLIWTLEAGGSENMLVDIANEQARYADVSIILINKKFNVDLIKRISSNVHFHTLDREEGNKRSMWFLFKLWNLLLKIQPDVIHCHNHSIIRLLPLFRKKTVLTIHCLNVSPVHLKKYRKVYAISGAVADDLRQRAGIVSPVVLNGINFMDIFPRHSYEASSIRLVQVGRMVHELKGQDLLLQALKKIVDKHKNVTLDFVGSGPSMSWLKQLTTSLGLDEHVTFLGEKNRNWIYNNLASYHILVQPSRFEGFGLTVLEGIAAGLPVIASDQAGPSEILQNMPGGYLFRSGDADDLAATIQKVITQIKEGEMQQVCATSREIADAKYSVRRTAFEYLEQYGQL